jgi:hypothetical protein
VELVWIAAGHWPSIASDGAFWPRVLGFFRSREAQL